VVEQQTVILVIMIGLHMVLNAVIQHGMNMVLAVLILKVLMDGIVQDVHVQEV